MDEGAAPMEMEALHQQGEAQGGEERGEDGGGGHKVEGVGDVGGARVCTPLVWPATTWAPIGPHGCPPPLGFKVAPLGPQGPLLGLLAKGPGPKLEEPTNRRKKANFKFEFEPKTF